MQAFHLHFKHKPDPSHTHSLSFLLRRDHRRSRRQYVDQLRPPPFLHLFLVLLSDLRSFFSDHLRTHPSEIEERERERERESEVREREGTYQRRQRSRRRQERRRRPGGTATVTVLRSVCSQSGSRQRNRRTAAASVGSDDGERCGFGSGSIDTRSSWPPRFRHGQLSFSSVNSSQAGQTWSNNKHGTRATSVFHPTNLLRSSTLG
ncbi:uncharacterized protein LOC118484033 [Helianthus annuus]|uniref:uncharacterized protein LOC118484033 n=1 Tax=Helianthus annuus TaxID=4232 RepID=UPI0016531922|nr:uncharacterized protein LOC118484033 [Helianthus annuus]